jgi:putative SOS response-associated peptidase YedK
VKVPYLIRRRDERPFAFAGLWERWRGPGEPVESCTILTTEPNELMAPIHDRMPVILDPADYDVWLDARAGTKDRVLPLLKPTAAENLVAFPVSKRVNSPSNDDAAVQEPASDESE